MKSVLNQLLKNPQTAQFLTIAQWELVLRQSAASKTTGRLYYLLTQAEVIEHVPPRVLVHMKTAQIKADCQQREILNEVNEITRCLAVSNITPIFLKGVAYVIAGIAHQGRTCNDVDILVPREQLDTAERLLSKNGWVQENLSHYDAQYYRQWMHELPPMVHLERKTVLDVHHHLLPLTSQVNFDISRATKLAKQHNKMWQGQPLCPQTLALTDMLLHSACHLFCEGELNKGLRDLTDINIMLEQLFGPTQSITPHQLIERAEILDLDYPLMLATRYINQILASTAPLDLFCCYKWRQQTMPRHLGLLDWCYINLLIPHHNSCITTKVHISALLIFIRSHYLRMPLRLLIPHLTIKWWHGIKTTFSGASSQ